MKNTLLRIAIALGLALGGAVHAADTVRYVILVDNGKKAGEQVVEHGDDGKTKVRFVFKDNGRGPELDEEYTLLPDGTFADYQVKGTTTFGAPVDETFHSDGKTATWKSTSETGSKSIDQPALYVPLGGTPQSASVALTLLAKSKDRTLPPCSRVARSSHR